ncbi:UNVERIFIED_CONTAM: hypothetical protein GTU68_012705 [Idotea baltica]
MFML